MPTTAQAGLVRRHFTSPGVDPLDAVEWERRDAWSGNDQYHRPNLEVPKSWSQQALDITSKLYLARGGYSEDSVRTLIKRVVDKITDEGVGAGYFDPDPDEDIPFHAELCDILVNQRAAFNSPVWFNIGREDRPQCPSACFLLSVEDNSDSIMQWARDEAFIFKAGAGSGSNISNIRGSMEPLSTGGIASGPVSFMRVVDSVGGTFKSGGTTRRAAALRCLDDDHPNIRDFITCKAKEEDRLRLLAEAGYNIGLDVEGERTVADSTSFQNANNSVRITDEFMLQATEEKNAPWPLMARKKGVFENDIVALDNADDLLDEIAQAAWSCADPGVQFHNTVNSWHTTPNDAPIRTTNPCAETSLPDDSSCNLASLNLLKFVDKDGTFDIEGFRQTVDVMVTAMDILVEFCELPTEKLTQRTKEFRWLGLGYSNLGAAIMAQGWPYDSDEARDFAASVSALLTGRGYQQSGCLAEKVGSFDGFAANRDSMLKIIERHEQAIPVTTGIWGAAQADWIDAMRNGIDHGFRNAQLSVLAPTGSISFFMDCDTLGVEPAFSLVSHKQLAGGGSMVLVNNAVTRGLKAMECYTEDEIEKIVADMEQGWSNGATDDPVFAGANDISPEGHVKMLAAVQPFISGSISKTVNMPSDATWEQIRDLYVMAWREGVKCLAIYRDGSKARQVLSTKPKREPTEIEKQYMPGGRMHDKPWVGEMLEGDKPGPHRKRLPKDREAVVHKLQIANTEGYITAGKHPDGDLGEIFVSGVGKDGSTLLGMVNAWAIAISVGLQYGVPLEVYARKYFGMSFPPAGLTENPEIRTARSIPDYTFRWLIARFMPELAEEFGIVTEEMKQVEAPANGNGYTKVDMGMLCDDCGNPMVQAGTCYACPACGITSGCS